jgi:hypothetical protein
MGELLDRSAEHPLTTCAPLRVVPVEDRQVVLRAGDGGLTGAAWAEEGDDETRQQPHLDRYPDGGRTSLAA